MSNVPDIRFKGFTDAWEQRELGEVVENIGTGKSKFIINNYDTENIYPILGSTGVIGFDNQYDYEGEFVLTARVGANAGNLYKYKGSVKISDNTVFIQNERNNFIYFLLSCFNLKKLSFGTGQPLIKASELKKLKLYLPNDQEQEKIETILLNLDDTITLLQRELDLENKTIEMFMDNLFIQKEQNIPCFNLSENTSLWKSVKLKEIGDTFTGLSGKNKDDFGHGDAWYITYMNVFSNPISNFNDKEKIEIDIKQNEVKYGDIFFTTSSETPNEVGMSSVWLGDDANIYLNSFCFGFRPKVELDPYFIAYLLRSKEVRMKISKLAQGISRYNISKTKMMEIEINIPDIKTQNEVGRILKELHEKKQITEKQIEKAKIIKKAFLQKLFPKGD
ncbi:restriction endonuclease subunit S [Macrococcoides caseolyticum]|uniref:restriction endonuclease subunit S n=1 Tax=Macrococcoides caseolyticum TaxID=69966 RepID=UPI00339D9843